MLDFGLAKAIEPARSAAADAAELADDHRSPAMTRRGRDSRHRGLHGAGAGARASRSTSAPTSGRSACVLYEMLTGRRAFERRGCVRDLAAVIQSEPRWDGVPARRPDAAESCLEKDPRKRLRDIGDAWTLLGDAREPTAAPSPVRNVGWMVAAALATKRESQEMEDTA